MVVPLKCKAASVPLKQKYALNRNICQLFSHLKTQTKINLFIYSWQEGEKTNGFWLELFIGQVPAVSARL